MNTIKLYYSTKYDGIKLGVFLMKTNKQTDHIFWIPKCKGYARPAQTGDSHEMSGRENLEEKQQLQL